jgi:hypothetical protein
LDEVAKYGHKLPENISLYKVSLFFLFFLLWKIDDTMCGRDILKWLVDNGTGLRTIGLSDALYGKLWATDIDLLGAKVSYLFCFYFDFFFMFFESFTLVCLFVCLFVWFSFFRKHLKKKVKKKRDLTIISDWKVHLLYWLSGSVRISQSKQTRPYVLFELGSLIHWSLIYSIRLKRLSFFVSSGQSYWLQWRCCESEDYQRDVCVYMCASVRFLTHLLTYTLSLFCLWVFLFRMCWNWRWRWRWRWRLFWFWHSTQSQRK